MIENNKAVITKISVSPHPNADRLQLGYCFGNQLIVGLETKDEDLGIFFSAGLQLSKEYATANDLIRRKDENGNPVGGMFDDNRKVRCQKFRGEKSEGYFAPLSSLEVLGIDISKLKENDCFDSLNGIPICNKFISEATARSKAVKSKKTRGETQFFKQHFDTAQWRLNKGEFRAGDLINISLKIHGTSQRVYFGLDERKLRLRDKIARKFGVAVDNYKVDHLVGTRRVIISDDSIGFHSDKLREDAAKPFIGKLHPGETVYYEVIGWDGATPIMPGSDTNELSKEEQKKYGKRVEYTYGLPQGEFDIYVYRITISLMDGRQIDLPWSAVKQRCKEMHVKHVIEVIPPFIFDGDHNNLSKLVSDLTEGDDLLYPQIPREGICVRAERYPTCLILKNKSFAFKVLEGLSTKEHNMEDAA